MHDALQDAHNNVALHYASLGGIKFRSQEGLKKTSHFRTLLDVKALISHKENILRRISCRVNFVQTASNAFAFSSTGRPGHLQNCHNARTYLKVQIDYFLWVKDCITLYGAFRNVALITSSMLISVTGNSKISPYLSKTTVLYICIYRFHMADHWW